MRAAYDNTALYLYFEIADNTWQPPAGYDADGVDFLLDPMSSQEIRDANPFDMYIQASWDWTLTYFTVQYQLNVGSASGALPSYLMINYFSGAEMMYNRVNLTALPTEYAGWDLDQASISANVRALELKIPWSWVGCSGGLGTVPASGKLIAMAGGYNDSDSPGQTGRKSLRWKERDPFNRCDDLHPASVTCDAWGDIQITGEVGVKNTIKPALSAKASSVQYFTVKGERLNGSQVAKMRAGTMVIERSLVGGTMTSKMIRTK